jgi:hypothetical protein
MGHDYFYGEEADQFSSIRREGIHFIVEKEVSWIQLLALID